MRKTILSGLAMAIVCAVAAAVGGTADLTSVESFAIQLQSADTNELADSGYDVVATDYSRDGSDAGAYSYTEIKTVRDSGKKVLGYLPLGELSDFRFYWKKKWRTGKPGFIGPENPNWPGARRLRTCWPVTRLEKRRSGDSSEPKARRPGPTSWMQLRPQAQGSPDRPRRATVRARPHPAPLHRRADRLGSRSDDRSWLPDRGRGQRLGRRARAALRIENT